MPLEGIDDIHGGDSLPLGVFGVGDSIPDDVLKEDLEDSTGLLIDESRDTLDSSTASQTPDGGLGDSLDVVSQHLTVTLGASLSESLSSFATSSHVAVISVTDDLPHKRCCLYRVLLPMMGRHPAIGRQGDTIRGGTNMLNYTFMEENLKQKKLFDILSLVSFPSLHTYFFQSLNYLMIPWVP